MKSHLCVSPAILPLAACVSGEQAPEESAGMAMEESAPVEMAAPPEAAPMPECLAPFGDG